MRLRSATVRHYRRHRDTTVDFAGESVLITGPNEAGKSTFVEAIRSALFLKGKISGEMLDAMRSTTHPGDPEVSVAFLDDTGACCRIEKTFGKNQTTLHIDGRPTLLGEEAETELARRLGFADTIDAKGGEKKLARRWAHLWVVQGASGSDPLGAPGEENEKLFRRLQELGGAAAQASDLDARVAGEFAKKADELWTKKGPAAQSPLAKARTAEIAAKAASEIATERLAKLETAAKDFQDAEKAIKAADAEHAEVTAELATLDAEDSKVRTLDADMALLEAQAAPLRGERERLEKGTETLAQQRGKLGELESQEKTFSAGLDEARAEVESLRALARRHEDAAESAARVAADIRKARAKNAAAARLSRAVSALDAARGANDAFQKETAEAAALDTRLAELPAVKPDHLSAVTKANLARVEAKAALGAAGASLRLMNTDGASVMLGDVALTRDAPVSLTEETELRIGDAIRITITPGGASGLRDAREKLREAERALAEALIPFGVKTQEDAAAIAEKVALLGADHKRRIEALKGRAEPIESRLKAALNEHSSASGEAARLGVPPGAEPDTTIPDNNDADRSETDARALAKKTAGDHEAARDKFTRLEKQNTARGDEITSLKASLKTLLSEYGEDDSRAETLAKKKADLAEIVRSVAEKKSARESLRPDSLDARRNRLSRSLKQNATARKAAGEKKAVAAADLFSDGRADPATACELALRDAERASAKARDLEVAAEAVKLLKSLFDKHRAEAAQRSAEPLALAAGKYLACVRGVGSTLHLDLSAAGDAFTGARLARSDQTTFGFEQLSAGAREQVGVALRLAMAETLAHGREGGLPVVLDDAFVNSDSERTRGVREMLDLAERSGLQIIAITCHPAQYSGMGWRAYDFV